MAFLLGVCYQKSGRTREALAAFEEVLRESEGHWRARYHTALLAIGGGRRAGAEGRRATAPSPSPSASPSPLLQARRRRGGAEARARLPAGARRLPLAPRAAGGAAEGAAE